MGDGAAKHRQSAAVAHSLADSFADCTTFIIIIHRIRPHHLVRPGPAADPTDLTVLPPANDVYKL